MAVETWYRGFALGVQPTGMDTGGLHDLGDGIYLAKDIETARAYASLRGGSAGAKGPMVFQVEIEMSRFNVLDLNADPRWREYLAGSPVPGITRQQLMVRSSETYFQFFQEYLKQNRLNLSDYDFVKGVDFHSGGTGRTTTQMVALYKGRQVSTLHGQLLSGMQLVEKDGIPVRVVRDPTLVVGGPNSTPGAAVRTLALSLGRNRNATRGADSKVPVVTVERGKPSATPEELNRRAIEGASRDAHNADQRMMGGAMAVAGLAFYLNNWSVESAVKDAIAKRWDEIERAFAARQGVLVVIHLWEEKYSEWGHLARSFHNIYLQPGPTADQALAIWRSTPGWFAALPRDAPYQAVEEYRWLAPSGDF